MFLSFFFLRLPLIKRWLFKRWSIRSISLIHCSKLRVKGFFSFIFTLPNVFHQQWKIDPASRNAASTRIPTVHFSHNTNSRMTSFTSHARGNEAPFEIASSIFCASLRPFILSPESAESIFESVVRRRAVEWPFLVALKAILMQGWLFWLYFSAMLRQCSGLFY